MRVIFINNIYIYIYILCVHTHTHIRTNMQVLTTQANLTFQVYKSKKSYLGQVSIPGNGALPGNGHRNSYAVIIVPVTQDTEALGYNKDMCIVGECDCCGVSRRYGNGPPCDCFSPELSKTADGTTWRVTFPFSSVAAKLRYQSLFVIAGKGDSDGDGIKDEVCMYVCMSVCQSVCIYYFVYAYGLACYMYAHQLGLVCLMPLGESVCMNRCAHHTMHVCMHVCIYIRMCKYM
jgi:hypothetical protein